MRFLLSAVGKIFPLFMVVALFDGILFEGITEVAAARRPNQFGFRLRRNFPFLSSSELDPPNKFASWIMQNRGGGGAVRVSDDIPNSNTDPKTSVDAASPQNYRGSGDVARVLAYDASIADPGSMYVTELLGQLDTTPESGLDTEEAKARLHQYGANELEKPPGKTMWQLIIEQFDDRLVQILLVVAFMSGIFSFLEVRQTRITLANSGDDSGEAAVALWKSFVEPLVIMAILVLNAIVGVWQSRSANNSLEALKKLQPTLATVLRDGEWISEMDAAQLVPGDIIEIRVGDKVPADVRLLSLKSSSLQADEGSLTGESVTVGKLPGNDGTVAENSPIQYQRGMLYSGTMITRGTGRAVVVQTGMDTQFGKIQKGITEAKSEESKTPLAIKLDEFGNQLTWIIGGICLAVWMVSMPKFSDPSFSSVWEGAIYYAKVAVALGVAAIPEGLPAIITLCLSLGTRHMAERNVIVRKLQSVETLGCTSIICTDKTGTLTTNEMTAVSLVLLDQEKGKGGGILTEHEIDGYTYSPIGSVNEIRKDKDVQDKPHGSLYDIAAVCALCNDAKIVGHDSIINIDDLSAGKKAIENTGKTYGRIGEPTEAALCVLAEKLGGMSRYYLQGGAMDNKNKDPPPPSILASDNVNGWREVNPRQATLEFNRDRKSMSVLCKSPKEYHANPKNPNKSTGPYANRLFVKGAPNLLLERCTHVKYRDGSVQQMTGELRRSIESKIAEMAARPLRCLALAVKENNKLPKSLRHFTATSEGDAANNPLLSDPTNYKNIESGLTLVGVVGIKDPARPEVAESIKVCTKAGIRVFMITGDAKATAVAIAKDVNIFPSKDGATHQPEIKAFEGREFFLKPEEEQLEILQEGNIVFCRAEPADKQKLIKMLQSLNEIPAMTGDGVNDAPALQQAAIGVAMGITGTEVSKEASDMVIADDNFSTIVNAVEEGRRIYANMQSFICFLISCNIGEICAIFFATIFGFPEPLTAMHLLWVNLVTDGPPATALGFNPPAPDLMTQPPRSSDEPILTKWLLIRYILTGLYAGLATIGVFAQHYIAERGISLSQLSKWSQCGECWVPPNGVCSDLVQGTGRMLPQTLALTTLVVMEMLKALSAVSLDSSIFSVGPLSNPWLLLGVLGPFLLHIFVLYCSMIGLQDISDSLGLVPLSASNWVSVLLWAAPILLVDETLKAVGRYLYREQRAKAAERAKTAATDP